MNFLKLLFYLLFFIFNPWSLAFSSESPYMETNIPKQELHLVILDQDDFDKQKELDNKVSFLSAVKRATQSLLSDYDEGNETPLDIVYERAYEQSSNDLSEDIHHYGKTLLSDLFELKNTSFTLVSINNVEKELGLNPYKYWVFQLKVPELGDHTFWCVVSRSGEDPAYTFGEN